MFFKHDLHFLSNMHYSRVLWHGTFWPTVEHAYQAAKCKDPEMEEEIRMASTPGRAKRLGRRVQVRSDWEEVKVDIMAELVLRKFCQNGELAIKLVETGDEHLEEGNTWHDNFWGNCYCEKCIDCEGLNALGIILMEVRDFVKPVGWK